MLNAQGAGTSTSHLHSTRVILEAAIKPEYKLLPAAVAADDVLKE